MRNQPVQDGGVSSATDRVLNGCLVGGDPETDNRRDTPIDREVMGCVADELDRQRNVVELIASENFASEAVLAAQGSVLTNKYAEGYPGRRYYGGCEHVDAVEDIAVRRAMQLFDCGFANVQPHSGAQANQAVFLALLKPGDTILSMDLAAGGHLSHGAPPNLSGKWFRAVHYGVQLASAIIDYDEVATLAQRHRPKLIIAGGSAYPRTIDFARFRHIADSVDAYLLVDMAHFAGLVAAGVHPSPIPHADVVTTTTHKTLRGPRGGMILSKDPELGRRMNSAVFPGLQGGPLMHVIAAKAVAFGEALLPAFKVYAAAVVENAQALARTLQHRGLPIVSGGTDTHLALVDLRAKGITGSAAENLLESANITCNKNAVPFDPEKPSITSGIRLGSPACTTRGFGVTEFTLVGHLIADLIDARAKSDGEASRLKEEVRSQVEALCDRFPIYPSL